MAPFRHTAPGHAVAWYSSRLAVILCPPAVRSLLSLSTRPPAHVPACLPALQVRKVMNALDNERESRATDMLLNYGGWGRGWGWGLESVGQAEGLALCVCMHMGGYRALQAPGYQRGWWTHVFHAAETIKYFTAEGTELSGFDTATRKYQVGSECLHPGSSWQYCPVAVMQVHCSDANRRPPAQLWPLQLLAATPG